MPNTTDTFEQRAASRKIEVAPAVVAALTPDPAFDFQNMSPTEIIEALGSQDLTAKQAIAFAEHEGITPFEAGQGKPEECMALPINIRQTVNDFAVTRIIAAAFRKRIAAEATLEPIGRSRGLAELAGAATVLESLDLT